MWVYQPFIIEMVDDLPDCVVYRQANFKVDVRILPQKDQSSGKEHDHWFAQVSSAVKNKPSHVVRKVIHLREAGVCLWTRGKTKSNTGLRRRWRLRRETPKTNKTVPEFNDVGSPNLSEAGWGTSLIQT
jgi:hypothetical protein